MKIVVYLCLCLCSCPSSYFGSNFERSEIMAFISHSFFVNIVVVGMFPYPFFRCSFYDTWSQHKRNAVHSYVAKKDEVKYFISFPRSALICNLSDQANFISLIYFCQHCHYLLIFILKMPHKTTTLLLSNGQKILYKNLLMVDCGEYTHKFHDDAISSYSPLTFCITLMEIYKCRILKTIRKKILSQIILMAIISVFRVRSF